LADIFHGGEDPLPDLALVPAQSQARHRRRRHVRCRNGKVSASLALVVLGHERRKVIHFDVTQNPTQLWLARQITEAFPWDTTPRFLLRDRDASYGQTFRDRVRAMAIEEVVTAPRSPWQNAYVERIIGSIRRECLDHVIVFDKRHLHGVLSAYFEYHHPSRTHLSLAKDCLEPRPIQPPSAGTIVAFPQVGGLHHRYERRAA
jgi:putative transposase